LNSQLNLIPDLVPRPFIVADDFGLSSSVNSAIINLASRKILSAVSCMTVYSDFSRDAHQLEIENLKIGIHFTLTGKAGRPLTTPSPRSGLIDRQGHFRSSIDLALRAFRGSLDTRAIQDELQAQLNRFRQTFHRNPDHLDSHEHVHQLPMVNQALIDLVIAEKLTAIPVRTTAQMQSPGHSLIDISKKSYLQYQGLSLKRCLHRNGLKTLPPVICNLDYRNLCLKSTEMCFQLAKNHPYIWIVHPGEIDACLISRDSLTHGRRHEYLFLLSLLEN
jgi:predicted glycoside hydrolase/deacetylase ChbG (UPF0249 family)